MWEREREKRALQLRSLSNLWTTPANTDGTTTFLFTLYGAREMENISKGPTFGDFVTIRSEASMQDVTVARLKSEGVQTPLSLLF
jgi:hypothetical protein